MHLMRNFCCVLVLLPGAVLAQSASAPPPPAAAPPSGAPASATAAQDLEPAVDTSHDSRTHDSRAPTAAASAGGSDLQPAVNTSLSQTADTPAAPASAPKRSPAPSRSPRPQQADRVDLGTTDITGNKELPTVTYIVPWKRSDLSDLTGKPVNSLVDEVLQPVDRAVFNRQNRYYEALAHKDAATGAPAQGRSP